jgi:glycosyltransferase involved in cell wall biosynthesis
MNNIICLDKKYSTTKLVTQEKPVIVNNSNDKFESLLFLPEDQERNGEGGLRTKGYFKKSYESKPLISIVTVVYNGEKYLEKTIQSVINQTYDNVEYIVIDGGSTDRTLDIIKKYEDKIDYWVSEEDRGIYDAMNKGIILSNGNIIGLVNADDFIYKDSLKKIAQIFENKEVMYTYGQIDLITEDGEKFDTAKSIGIENFRYKLFNHMPYLHPTMFIRKKVYKELGLYSLLYKLSADYDFILKIVKNGYKSEKLDFSTGVFRMGGASGGIKSYLENHKLLLKHNVNWIVLNINTFILITKLYTRKFFGQE